MPLFEYRCDACEHLEEVLQKHNDPAPDACPRCGAQGTMKKALSLTSFQLKGGGWYKDLYSSSKPDSSSSKSESTSSSSTSKSESASPSSASPAAKSDTKADAPKKDVAAPAKPAASSTASAA